MVEKDRTEQRSDGSEVQAAKALLESSGYVVLKEKSYRQAQERQRVAEARLDCALRDAETSDKWARDCLAEERRMRDRVTFLYGAARARGASVEELRGPALAGKSAGTIGHPGRPVRCVHSEVGFCPDCRTSVAALL